MQDSGGSKQEMRRRKSTSNDRSMRGLLSHYDFLQFFIISDVDPLINVLTY